MVLVLSRWIIDLSGWVNAVADLPAKRTPQKCAAHLHGENGPGLTFCELPQAIHSLANNRCGWLPILARCIVTPLLVCKSVAYEFPL